MKKIKVLPLLLVAPLLTSCGNNVKAPKFVKEGDKLEDSKWNDDMNEAVKGSFYVDTAEDYKLPSFVDEEKGSSSTEETIKREKSVLYEKKSYSESTSKLEYDADALMNKVVSKSKTSQSEKDSNGIKAVSKSSSKNTTTRQKYSEEGKDYCISIDGEEKEFSKYLTLTESIDMEYALKNSMLFSVAPSYVNLGFSYLAYSLLAEDSPEKAYYSFFENAGKKAFTLSYEKKEENVETKNASDEVIYTTTTVDTYKYQVVFGQDSLEAYGYSEKTITETYVKETSAHSRTLAAGDVYTKVQKSASSSKAKVKKVGLKAVDISDYKKLGTAW
jgi:hypothetical protein